MTLNEIKFNTILLQANWCKQELSFFSISSTLQWNNVEWNRYLKTRFTDFTAVFPNARYTWKENLIVWKDGALASTSDFLRITENQVCISTGQAICVPKGGCNTPFPSPDVCEPLDHIIVKQAFFRASVDWLVATWIKEKKYILRVQGNGLGIIEHRT